MKKLLVVCLVALSLSSYGQSSQMVEDSLNDYSYQLIINSIDSLQQQINALNVNSMENTALMDEVSNSFIMLGHELKTVKKKMNNQSDSLVTLIQQNRSLSNKTKRELLAKIQENHESISTIMDEVAIDLQNEIRKVSSSIETVRKESSEKIDNEVSVLENVINQNTLYWILGIGLSIILIIVVYLLLQKSIKSNRGKAFEQLEATRRSFEEENVKLDNKLIDLLEKQMQVKEESKQLEKTGNEEPDHSLAVKVADEIVRIQKNLSQMDDKTRGKKQLNASVERIRSNFEANGYEIVNMLNKPFVEGMNASVTFKQDDSIDSGKQIITKVLKPQINFNGIMIQPAQIEVTQNI